MEMDIDEIDRILDRYEEAAKEEQYYLLLSHFPLFNSDYQLQCGLSPARTFAPVIILQQQTTKIVFSTYEWYDLIQILQCVKANFFQVPGFHEVSAPMWCGDYIQVDKLVYEGVKQLGLTKHMVVLYLLESDVDELLNINLALISNHIEMLDQLNFCMYLNNILDIVRDWISSNKTILSISEIIEGICNSSANCMLSKALREYLFYFRDKIDV